ncbi:NDP-hexose 2,3-dehydratase [Streptomyces venezuelae]|uniref:NDP-hexose 2,3-dehydratase n=1 Tax=Streptomyces venezuelae TaxID=54571 RepID=A0A5P2D0X4_STRVZ|nr:NDP-hexose 2,3-dehydratase family protein [Streptomyces venezuelae]QES48794.1 NDP-hexose 2,3-dehydratase [Streptomyces venezuelae]
MSVPYWVTEARERIWTRAEQVPLEALADWDTDPAAGGIRHRSGRFFSVEGLGVRLPGHPVPHWQQPIINQPETGLLGLLTARVDGVPHALIQLKPEPGNWGGLQLSPTVQATRSNYTGVHRGAQVPYLEHFLAADPKRVTADLRLSEHGSWFLGKRNRNMIVEAGPEAGAGEPAPGFRWLSFAELRRLLAVDDLVNMDTRSVLSCLPAVPAVPAGTAVAVGPAEPGPALHGTGEILGWINRARSRSRTGLRERLPLDRLAGWRRADGRIGHDSGRFFEVIGVRVEAAGREVGGWDQPMIAPRHTGVLAFLLTRIDGVPHILVQLRAEAGALAGPELAPTVQCTPENYELLPAAARPAFLAEVLGAAPEAVRFDTVLSDEGGRFHHSRSRHLIVELDPAAGRPEHPDYRWVTPGQLRELLHLGPYVNMQARSLLACLDATC